MPFTRRRLALYAAAALGPWAWFVVRDAAPELNAFAIGLPPVALMAVLGGLLLAITRRNGAIALVTASWAAMAVVAITGPWVPQGGAPPVEGVRVVAANVFGREFDASRVIEELQRERADVLVVSEITRGLARDLAPSYAHSVVIDGTVAVYARWPLRHVENAPRSLLAFGVALEVAAPQGTFVLYALHLPRPWPRAWRRYDVSLRDQRALIETLLEAVRAESRPVVVAGDLNLSDRTSGYRALTTELKDAMRATRGGPTSVRWAPLLLRIDHILVSPSWCADESRRFGLTGSDHHGVASVVGRCDSAAAG